MFENLSEHSAILVSGPPRSGTRICAQMVSSDTRNRFIDETEIQDLFLGKSLGDKNQDWDKIGERIIATVQKLIDQEYKSPIGFVLHCPPFMPWLHKVFGAHIIVMRRSISDIQRSINRIGFKANRQELEYNKMGYTQSGRKKSGLIKTFQPLAKLKYEYWDSHQKKEVKNHQEVGYESLKTHALWIPKQDRLNFRWDQTRQ